MFLGKLLIFTCKNIGYSVSTTPINLYLLLWKGMQWSTTLSSIESYCSWYCLKVCQQRHSDSDGPCKGFDACRHESKGWRTVKWQRDRESLGVLMKSWLFRGSFDWKNACSTSRSDNLKSGDKLRESISLTDVWSTVAASVIIVHLFGCLCPCTMRLDLNFSVPACSVLIQSWGLDFNIVTPIGTSNRGANSYECLSTSSFNLHFRRFFESRIEKVLSTSTLRTEGKIGTLATLVIEVNTLGRNRAAIFLFSDLVHLRLHHHTRS